MAFDDTSKNPNPGLIDHLTGYLETRIDLVKLETQEAVSGIFIGVIHGVVLALLGLMFLIFVSIFAGFALNSALNSPFWGFGIVAGVYLLLTVLVLIGVDKTAFKGLANKVLKDSIYKSDKRA